jgi:hypothetical protein
MWPQVCASGLVLDHCEGYAIFSEWVARGRRPNGVFIGVDLAANSLLALWIRIHKSP